VVVRPETDSIEHQSTNGLHLDRRHVILETAPIREAIHIWNRLHRGIGSESRIGKPQHRCHDKSFAAEILAVAWGDGSRHVEAKHVTERWQEVVDEGFAGREWISVLARRK